MNISEKTNFTKWFFIVLSVISMTAISLVFIPMSCSINPKKGRKTVELSKHPIKEDPSWKTYMLNSKGTYVYPKSVNVEGNSEEIRNPEGILSAHPMADLSEIETCTISSSADTSSRIIVDLGKTASGYVELGVVNASGAPIRMSYAEYLPALDRWGDGDTRADTWFFSYGNTGGPDDDPDGRADVFPAPLLTPPKTYTVLISPGIRGSQRYIAISLDGEGTAILDFVRVRQTNYSGDYDGHFLCSDEILNNAWYASAYAVDLSTARDTRFNPDANWIIMDGPKRDRLAYNNDLRNSGLSALYQGIKYHEIVRNCLNLFAVQQLPDGTLPFSSRIDVPYKPYQDPGPADGMVQGYEDLWTEWIRIDSYTLWWIIQLDDYLLYSGDREFTKLMMPVARRAIAFFMDKTEADSALWITDAYDGKIANVWHTPDECTGIDVYGNEAYYGALRSLARLERDIAGDENKALELEGLAERVKRELIREFWDEEAGAMLLNSQSPKEDHPADANVGALLFGLLDSKQAERVIDHLNTRLGSSFGTLNSEFDDNPYMSQYISPYIMSNEAIARFQYNDGLGALNLIRKAWGNMLKEGAHTPWEEVGINGKPETIRTAGRGLDYMSFLDLAHAWSTAIPALSMHLIGVVPTQDGYSGYNVCPILSDISWAQGTIPTQKGGVSVRWIRGKNDSSFVMTVEGPEGCKGNISVPLLAEEHIIAVDGKVAWLKNKSVNGFKAIRQGDMLIFNNFTGVHTFAWTTE